MPQNTLNSSYIHIKISYFINLAPLFQIKIFEQQNPLKRKEALYNNTIS